MRELRNYYKREPIDNEIDFKKIIGCLYIASIQNLPFNEYIEQDQIYVNISNNDDTSIIVNKMKEIQSNDIRDVYFIDKLGKPLMNMTLLPYDFNIINSKLEELGYYERV